MTVGECVICASHADVEPLAVAHVKPELGVRGLDASNPAGFACGIARGLR